MGRLELDHGKFVEAEDYFKRSLEIFTKFNAKGYMERLMKKLGDTALGMENYDQAQEYYEEMVQLARITGKTASMAVGYHFLGELALHKGDDQEAEKYFYEALKIDREAKWRINYVWDLLNFAFLAAFRGKPIAATRSFGAFFAILEALQREEKIDHNLIEPIDQLIIILLLPHYQAQIEIDNAEFDQAWNDGSLLSLDDAISEILRVCNIRD